MTQKELFKGKIVELFNSLLPNNTIDDFSLEIVETKEHTTLFDLLNSLESSENPPICTRETDDAVNVIYPNITFIFPHDFKRVKLFYNSDVKIYIKRPEYVELHELTDFICGLDSEMNHWKNMWRYFHDLDVLKLKRRIQAGDKCRKLIDKIEYPFNEAKIEAQRLEYYNINASCLFIDNEMFDYVYQKSLDMILERCRAHRIYPDAEEWKGWFDDILKEKKIQHLIAEERKAANRRKNTKIHHLLSLGQARFQAALAGINLHDLFHVSFRFTEFDLDSLHHVLQHEYYHLHIDLDGSNTVSITIPYVRLSEVIGQVVEALKEMNALMPRLEEDLRQYEGKYMFQRNYYSKNNSFPFCLVPAEHRNYSFYFDDFDYEVKVPRNETLKKFNSIWQQLVNNMNLHGNDIF